MPLKKRRKKKGQKKGEIVFVLACAVALVLFVGIKTVRHRVPEDVRRASLVLQAMERAQCVGDVWGLDIYLERKNEELLTQSFSKEKCLIAGLFAETLLRSGAWERPLTDLKYAFYVLREEKLRRLSEATVFLIRLKEWWRDRWVKEEPLSSKEALTLKTLREEELALPPEEMGKRYQAMIWKVESDEIKMRLLAREAHLDQEQLLPRLKRRLQELKDYERRGVLPFSLVLATEEMGKGSLMKGRSLGPEGKPFLVRDREVLLQEYQKALQALASGDSSGFVEKAEALAMQYEKRDFAPLLLYQAWSVAAYDLQDRVGAERLLAKMKKEYPVSDWAYPERASAVLRQGVGFKMKRPRSLGEVFLPWNIFRAPAKKITEGFIEQFQKISDGLVTGATREIVADEATAQEQFVNFLPAPLQKRLQGYQVNFCDEGARVFFGVNVGFWDIVFLCRGALEAETVNGARTMALKLREIRLFGVAIPRAFLRQMEGDFRVLVEQAALPLDLIEAKYWEGGAKFVFEKGDLRERGLLSIRGSTQEQTPGEQLHA